MRYDDLEILREKSRLALMSPGEAIAADRYEEHLLAVKEAPRREALLLNHIEELESLLNFSQQCARFHRSEAERAKQHADRLWPAAQAYRGQAAQSKRIRQMWLDMRMRMARRSEECARLARSNFLTVRLQ